MPKAEVERSSLQGRLLDSQKQALLGNRVLLLLAAQKLDAAGTAFHALASRFPDYPRLKLLQAALLAQAGKVQRRTKSAHLLPAPEGVVSDLSMPTGVALADISCG